MRTILIEGASTAHGWFDEEHGGWTNRLGLSMMGRNQECPTDAIVINNCAMPGAALSAVLKGFEADLVRAQRSMGPILPILSVGLNEARTFPGREPSVVPADRFKAQLGQYLIDARATNYPAILVGPQWVDETKTQPVAKLGFSVTNNRLEEYGAIMQEVALKEDATYVDIFTHFRDNGGVELLSTDGCHPNALGHAAIHRQVLTAIESTNFL